MRTSMAYFAGAGTVIAALAAGLGGGLVIADIMSPPTRTLGKAELQAKAQSAEQAAAQSPQPQSSQPQPQLQRSDVQQKEQAPAQPQVPYLAQTERAAAAPVVVSPAPKDSPPQLQAEEKPQNVQPPQRQGESAKEPVRESAKADPQAATTANGDQASRPENAYAKARDADLKRLDDKRKAEQRRQQWAGRHPRDREQEPRDEDHDVRGDTDQREVIVRRDDLDRRDLDRRDYDRRDYDRRDEDREDEDRPMRFPFPRFNLFGPD